MEVLALVLVGLLLLAVTINPWGTLAVVLQLIGRSV